jgi:hypothetical protein
MFARALSEFILWAKPCTNAVCMTEGAWVRCRRSRECGVAGTYVCWEAGAYVVVGRHAASGASINDTDGRGGWSMQRMSRQGEEDPEGQRQGDVCWFDGGAVDWFRRPGSDVLSEPSVVFGHANANFRRCVTVIHTDGLELLATTRHTALGHTGSSTRLGALHIPHWATGFWTETPSSVHTRKKGCPSTPRPHTHIPI